jgi:DNA-3-methyladenine glycosylase II
MSDPTTIALNTPYDFARSIGFWSRSTLELCEQWADGVYRRIVVLDGVPVIITVRDVGSFEEPRVAIEVGERAARLDEMAVLEPMIRHMLGDDVDLRGFYAEVSHDPVLSSVTQQLYGVRPPRSPFWETLCWVIIGQQISLPFARTLKARLVTRYADAFEVAGRPLHLFPPPERLARVDINELLAMQFSRNKASFVLGLAQQIADGAFDLDALGRLPTEQAVNALVAYRGIGRWTAEFTLMRALGRRDALPANDAGVRQSITALYGVKLPEAELRAFARRWGEWGGLAALYLLGWLKEYREAAK